MISLSLRNERWGAAVARREAPAVSSLWRAGLIIGCAAALGAAAWVGHPAAYLEDDPTLARLLRGMALIKALVVVGALSAVLWRLGWSISARMAAGYAIATSLLAGSTMLIWQLSYIPLAAVLFHGTALGMLYLGWRDR